MMVICPTSFFFMLIQNPPISTLFPTRRSSDLLGQRLGSRRHLRVGRQQLVEKPPAQGLRDRKSTRLNSSHEWMSYAVFCLIKKIFPAPLSADDSVLALLFFSLLASV